LLSYTSFTWMDFTNTAEEVAATQGSIDLRENDTNHDFKIKLQKKWELYPYLLITSEGVKPSMVLMFKDCKRTYICMALQYLRAYPPMSFI